MKQIKVLYSVVGVLLLVVGVMAGIIVAKSGDSSPTEQVAKQEVQQTSQKKEQKRN